jgi:hypothetical protein
MVVLAWTGVVLVVRSPAMTTLRLAFSSPTVNFKLTLQVEVDGVVHTGSSVLQTRWGYQLPWLRGFGYNRVWQVGAHGEATIIDLGERGLLFELLTEPIHYYDGKGIDDVSITAGGMLGYLELNMDDGPEVFSRQRDPVNIPPGGLPLLVRFRDIQDPRTVEQVDPVNLTATFGPGVRFVRATIAVTDAPVTTGIETRVQWLDGLKTTLNGNRFSTASAGLADSLGPMAFKQ